MYYGFYGRSFKKQIILYKIQAIIFTVIILTFTFFNTNFPIDSIRDKAFSLLPYENFFIKVFYCIALGLLAYTIYILSHIWNKDTIFFSINQEDSKIQLFNALIKRHILFIMYFIFSYLPLTLYMIIKFLLYANIGVDFYISCYTMVLVSLYGVFLLGVKLFDPIMRDFLQNEVINKIFFFCIRREEITINNCDSNMRISLGETLYPESNALLSSINQDEDNSLNTKLNIEMKELGNKNLKELVQPNRRKENYIQESNIIPENMNESDLISAIASESFNKSEKDQNINNSNNSNNDNNNTKNDVKEIYPSLLSFKSLPTIVRKQSSNDHLNRLNISDGNNSPFSENENDNDTNSIKRNISVLSEKKNKKENLLIRNRNNTFSAKKSHYIKEGLLLNMIKEQFELDDNLVRMLAISSTLISCRIYESNFYEETYFNSRLPWEEEKFYKEKSSWFKYNQWNLPDELSEKIGNNFPNVTFRIKSFNPLVFHHLRSIDNVSINQILQSLDPIKNLSNSKDLKLTGGRGNNTMTTTWDKKIIIKTISKGEKKMFRSKMIKDYHYRMRDTKSILSRIYGLYNIQVGNKAKVHVLLQKNMCELPYKTNLLTFDLKGSTVDRQSISDNDSQRLSKEILMEKYKKTVLKDKDLKLLEMQFNLSSINGINLIKILENDSIFLKEFNVIDYSLLVFVHKYDKEDMIKNFGNLRIMASIDLKYIFNFSIIDFFGAFTFERKSEMFAKELVSIIKQKKDKNFSVLGPTPYADRFLKFAKSIINIDKDEYSLYI